MTCRSSPGLSNAPNGASEAAALQRLWSSDLNNRLRVAEAVVREASRIAADHFARRELLSIDRKGAQDLVSEADRACEDLTVAGYRACVRKIASSAKSAARAIRRRPRSG